MKIKKGDNVIVTAGKFKGEKGKVMRVIADSNRVIVEGVNKIKRHIRPKRSTEKGTIVEREAALHASNVMILDAESKKPTRIATKIIDGKKVRIAVKSGKELK